MSCCYLFYSDLHSNTTIDVVHVVLAEKTERTPPARWKHQSAKIGDDILVWGGQTIDKATGEKILLPNEDIWCFNVVNKQWSLKKAIPGSQIPPLGTAGRCCVFKSKVYSYGGLRDGEKPEFYRHMYTLCTRLNGMEWKNLEKGFQPMFRGPRAVSLTYPVGQKDCGLSVIGDKILMTGGYGLEDTRAGKSAGYEWVESMDGEGCSNDQFVFNTLSCENLLYI